MQTFFSIFDQLPDLKTYPLFYKYRSAMPDIYFSLSALVFPFKSMTVYKKNRWEVFGYSHYPLSIYFPINVTFYSTASLKTRYIGQIAVIFNISNFMHPNNPHMYNVHAFNFLPKCRIYGSILHFPFISMACSL